MIHTSAIAYFFIVLIINIKIVKTSCIATVIRLGMPENSFKILIVVFESKCQAFLFFVKYKVY